jgi:DNA-binding transcriptional MerR regulator
MTDDDRLFTIGELACQAGKTPRALRLYEQLGLLEPRGRSDGGFRLYGRESLVRLQWIQQLTDLGLPLNEIQALLDRVNAAPTGGDAMAEARTRFRERLAEVEAQIVRLATLRDGLRASLAYLEKCDGCTQTALPKCCGGCSRHDGEHAPDLVVGMRACPDGSRIALSSKREHES